MATEIERKFLVRSADWRVQVSGSEAIVQGYLSATPDCSVRVRIAGDRATLNIKGLTVGARRSEYEYPVPVADAREMLNAFCGSRIVDKVRHLVPGDGAHWEVDEFRGDNAGLIVAEIELDDESSDFHRPGWLGDEVTDDPRYYNQNLADHPFRTWSDV